MKASIQILERGGVALFATALLLPVGDAPWFSFWREWTAAIAALLIVLGAMSRLRDLALPLRLEPWSLATMAIALAVLCWVQHAAGLVPYRSDALMPSLYLIGFAACAIVAGSLPVQDREALADRLAAALLTAALLSVPLAVLQWIGWLRLDLGVRVAGGRPVAHMEQANLLCSLLIQGAFGAWRLTARGRIRAWTVTMLLAPILLAIALTQSRVAWLVSFVLLGVVAWRHDVFDWRLYGRALVAALIAVVLGGLLLPWIDGLLGLPGAALAERVSEGRRPAAWILFMDAALTHPWSGWGVLQNGTAQFTMADQHPALAYLFSSAHNIVLDLVIWFGIPMGLFASGALLIALTRRVALAPNLAALTTVLAATALVLHALVELPLHYTYFLLPLGLFLGISSGERYTVSNNTLRVSTTTRALIPAVSLSSALMLALLGREYIQTTNVRPVFAIDKATRHPVLLAELPAPADVMLLDQLRAFHVFAALPLTSGVAASELDAARVAMRRAPYSAAIERYALLAGFNGREADALDTLSRVCKFETPQQCARSRDAWATWHQQWPGLPPNLMPPAQD